MAIISTLWNFGKGTGKYVCGAIDNALNPSRPIPRTELHPRMPAYPLTPGEWVRMFPYRHYWRFMPFVRHFFFAVVVYELIFGRLFREPVNKIKSSQLGHTIHHMEGEILYGQEQRKQDAKYFTEYDPKAELRPEWFKEELGWMKLNYYPHGYSEQHGH